MSLNINQTIKQTNYDSAVLYLLTVWRIISHVLIIIVVIVIGI